VGSGDQTPRIFGLEPRLVIELLLDLSTLYFSAVLAFSFQLLLDAPSFADINKFSHCFRSVQKDLCNEFRC
jgi:hypothetical protein